jgi:hypothetical protein
MKLEIFKQWARFTTNESAEGVSEFQPTRDKLIGRNDNGLRLHVHNGTNCYYLAQRLTDNEWRAKPYPFGSRSAVGLASRRNPNFSVTYYPYSIWSPELLILTDEQSMLVALSEYPEPDLLASLHMRFRPPFEIDWPGKG